MIYDEKVKLIFLLRHAIFHIKKLVYFNLILPFNILSRIVV